MHDFQRKIGSLLNQVGEPFLRHCREAAIRSGDRCSTSRSMIDERHLPEHTADADTLQNDPVLLDCDLSFDHGKHAVAGVSLGENRLASAKGTNIRLSLE